MCMWNILNSNWRGKWWRILVCFTARPQIAIKLYKLPKISTLRVLNAKECRAVVARCHHMASKVAPTISTPKTNKPLQGSVYTSVKAVEPWLKRTVDVLLYIVHVGSICAGSVEWIQKTGSTRYKLMDYFAKLLIRLSLALKTVSNSTGLLDLSSVFWLSFLAL